MSKEPNPKTIFLKDYQKPAYDISETYLVFDIHEGYTEVRARLPEFAGSRLSERGVLVEVGSYLFATLVFGALAVVTRRSPRAARCPSRHRPPARRQPAPRRDTRLRAS